jgi:hypothetical protein
MTLPEESERAVAATREFLLRLASPYGEGGIKGVRREVRAEALALLRHYPHVWLSKNGDCPDEDNAAKRDNTPAAHATPSEGSVQDRCTLTDVERAAIERAVRDEDVFGHVYTADVLRGLLERLG